MYNFVKRHPDLRIVNAFVRYYSLTRKKTHYEVLNLRRNCTDKEIKEAFIQMSKEYHPDKNKDKNAQQHFVRIVEAYNTLSKPGSRAQYDSLTEINTRSPYSHYYEPHSHRQNYYQRHYQHECKEPPRDYYGFSGLKKVPNYVIIILCFSVALVGTLLQVLVIRHYQHECKEPPRDYYGFSGLKKVPNYVVIILCFSVALVGTLLQVLVIREMYIANRRKAQQQSQFLSDELERVRAAARRSTNDIHTKLLLEKIVQSANPTIATASLGQALANEKKDQGNILTEFGLSDMSETWLKDSVEQNIDQGQVDS